MKKLPLALIALVLASLGSACTFVFQPKAGAGRVIISAQGPQTPSKSLSVRSATLDKTAGREGLFRSAAVPTTRNLSATTDIEPNGITYTVYEWTGSAWALFDSGIIDPYYLSAEFFLTPGGDFRIVVDVDITPTAPGTNVGVTRYGDQADFTVDDYYDTYVNLTIHPSQAIVFDPASAVSANPSTIDFIDPSLATPIRSTRNFLGGPLTVDPADKLFYGPDADLLYFNRTANAIYRWPNIATPIDPIANKVVDGLDSFDTIDGVSVDTTVQIYAACADPGYSDTLWVVGQDLTDNEWYYFLLDLANNSVSRSSSITGDLEFNLSGTITVVPTGIAVDTTYRDVYITFYSHDGTGVESAVMLYYNDGFEAQYPASSTFIDDTSAIFTDVVWEKGMAWVITSPNTNLPGISSQTGVAQALVFNDFLSLLTTPPGSTTYSGSGVSLASSPTTLVLPNRFTGPIQGNSLYFSQQDFAGSAGKWLSALDLETGDVVSY